MEYHAGGRAFVGIDTRDIPDSYIRVRLHLSNLRRSKDTDVTEYFATGCAVRDWASMIARVTELGYPSYGCSSSVDHIAMDDPKYCWIERDGIDWLCYK